MSDLASRIHLLDEKLTLSPDLVSSFDCWSTMGGGGRTAKLDLAASGVDDWLRPACADFSRLIGPRPGTLSVTQVNNALQNSLGSVSESNWAGLAELLAAIGRSTWPKLTVPELNPFSGKPAQIGNLQPDGTPLLTTGTGLIDGVGIDFGSLPFGLPKTYWRRYAFSTHFDVSPIIFFGIDASPLKAPFVRGGGVGIKIGDGIKIEAGVGAGQTGAPAGGLLLKIDMWRH